MGRMKKIAKKNEEIIKGLIEKLEKIKPEIIPGEGSDERLRKLQSLKTLDEKSDYVGRIGAIRMMKEGTFDFAPYIEKHKKKLLQNSLSIKRVEKKEKKMKEIKEIRKLELSRYAKDKRVKSCAKSGNEPLHPESGMIHPIEWEKLERDEIENTKGIFCLKDIDKFNRLKKLLLDDKKSNKTLRKNATKEEILLNRKKKKATKALKNLLKKEFIKEYKKYRKKALKAAGMRTDKYEMMEKEEKYADEAGQACFLKGVLPVQACEYWHENRTNFVNGRMVAIPLSILGQPSNIDEVAVRIGVGGFLNRSNRKKKKTGESEVNSCNPMSNVSKLHPRLRKALMDECFDLSEMGDQHLIFIQVHAIGIVQKRTTLTSVPYSLREITKWAAKNFYNKIEDLDKYRS